MISVRGDVKSFSRHMRNIEEKYIDKAANQALNKTIKTVQSVTVKDISKSIKLKQKRVRDRYIVRKSRTQVLTATITVSGKAYNLIDFVSPGKRQPGAFENKEGVAVRIGSGKSSIRRGTFIIRGSGGKVIVAQRTTDARNPIVGKLGPSLPKMFRSARIRKLTNTTSRKRFPIEYERALKNIIRRSRKGKR